MTDIDTRTPSAAHITGAGAGGYMDTHWILPQFPLHSYQDYLSATGENAVERARAMDPADIIALLTDSGLRGRGGAGFPTGRKWQTIASHPCPTRSVICNAAEGEPGTFKDRFLLRRNPYSTIEGMLIAAHAIGTKELHLAIKTRYRKELTQIEHALAEMTEAGLLEGLTFNITRGPDEYLFGEEKALLNVIEGTGPLPREAHYPPYERGLRAGPHHPNPALVNNVETFAHVPSIVRFGADSFRELGTADTPGTVLYTICGDTQVHGVFECEAGITLNELFALHGGGPLPDRRFKAMLSGVASAVLTADRFDTPADFGSLAEVGSGLGSAGFIAIDDATSIPRVAQSVARFLYVESCGQCSPCKSGLARASEFLDALLDPAIVLDDMDLERLRQAARSAPQQNRCYLPVQGSVLIPSLLDTFREEFEAIVPGVDTGAPPWPIPKIAEYNARKRRFIYDDRAAYKRPDWTYSRQPFAA